MKKKKFTVDKMTFVAFTIIPLILYTFFYFISVSCGIYYSLTDWNGLNREYNFVGIANYIALSKNVFMWRSLWRTLLYACMLVVCVTVLSLIIALAHAFREQHSLIGNHRFSTQAHMHVNCPMR